MEIRLILSALESSCGILKKLSTQGSEAERWNSNLHRSIHVHARAASLVMMTEKEGALFLHCCLWRTVTLANTSDVSRGQTSDLSTGFLFVFHHGWGVAHSVLKFSLFLIYFFLSLRPKPFTGSLHSHIVGIHLKFPLSGSSWALPPFSPDLFYLLSFHRKEQQVLEPFWWPDEHLWHFPLHRNNEAWVQEN